MAQEKFYFKNLDSPMRLIDENIIENIIDDYKSGEFVSTIVEKYDIKIEGGIAQNLPARLTSKNCKYCDKLLYEKIKRIGSKVHIATECLNCKHKSAKDCKCENCAEAERKSIHEHRKSIKETSLKNYQRHYNINYTLDDLSIYDAIYLTVFLRLGDDPIRLIEKDETDIFDSITDKKDYENLKIGIIQLIERKILIPSEDYYATEDYSFLPAYMIPTFSTYDVRWIPNIKDKTGKLFNSSNLLIYLNNIKFTFEQKEILFKEIYTNLIKKTIRFQTKNFEGLLLSDQLTEKLIEEFFPKYPLSKVIAIFQMAVKSTEKIKNDSKEILNNTELHFLNILNALILKYDDLKNLKDLNLPPKIKLDALDFHIIDNIFRLENTYFYLSPSKILEFKF